MSGFIHGGSALTLDIGARNQTGATVTVGDVLQLDITAATEDGYDAVVCQTGDTDIGNYSFVGAVLGKKGGKVVNGESLILRIVGKCKALCTTSAAYSVSHVLTPTDGAKTMAASVAPDIGGTITGIDFKPRAVCLEAVGSAAAGQTLDVFMIGFPI